MQTIWGIEFDEKEENGKYLLVGRSLPTTAVFKEINKIAKTKGGMFKRPFSFVFNEKPNFNEDVAEVKQIEKKPEPKPSVHVVQITSTAKKEADAKKKAEAEKKAEKKKPNKKSERTSKKGKTLEFEIYPVESIDTCVEHINGLMEKFKGNPDHEATLKLLREACMTDEELRSFLLHKDYEKMLFEGAREMVMKTKEDKQKIYISAGEVGELVPYVIEQYKKPVQKSSKAQPTKEETTETETEGDEE